MRAECVPNECRMSAESVPNACRRCGGERDIGPVRAGVRGQGGGWLAAGQVLLASSDLRKARMRAWMAW